MTTRHQSTEQTAAEERKLWRATKIARRLRERIAVPAGCERKEFFDPNGPDELGFDLSDIAVDDHNNVFTTHTPSGDASLAARS